MNFQSTDNRFLYLENLIFDKLKLIRFILVLTMIKTYINY